MKLKHKLHPKMAEKLADYRKRKGKRKLRVQRIVSRRPRLPMSLFDTYAVWLEVQKHPNNVTKTDVADVLDAIVAIERRGEAANK